MQLHHRTYQNLGNEFLRDLVPMCPGCHQFVHDLYKSDPKWRRRGLWHCTKAARRYKRSGYSSRMTTKKSTKKASAKQGTKQETADDSGLGKKPTSAPAEGGPVKPADSPYAG